MTKRRSIFHDELENAVKHYWLTRERQSLMQGKKSGRKDYGARSAVTGGGQLAAFADLIKQILTETGIEETAIRRHTRVELPGYFRPEKKWDIVVVMQGRLLAAVELKAQAGPSFGNNFNNRAEEAVGSAADFWRAYREGAFSPSSRPWLGYLMLLEECSESTRPVSVIEPHFHVLPEFRNSSYVQRYKLLLDKMVREGLYDSACLIMSQKESGKKGQFTEPCELLSFANFAESLVARCLAHLRIHR